MKLKFINLWLAGVVSTAIGLPYILELQKEAVEKMPFSFPVVVLISLAQSSLLLAIAVFFGLKLSQKIGLSQTLFPQSTRPLQVVRIAVSAGVAVALIIRLADLFFLARIPELARVSMEMPFWKAISVAPYGGIVEELLMRLFLVSLFAWLMGKITRTGEITSSNKIMWLAIFAVSILFGIGHLPATATIVALTPIVIVRAILLNGLGGLVFGWLYWKRGLGYAIVAHFTTDVVLHAIIPTLLKLN